MSRTLSELQNTHVLSGLAALKGIIRISQLFCVFICVDLVISYLTVYCFPAMILFDANDFKALTFFCLFSTKVAKTAEGGGGENNH